VAESPLVYRRACEASLAVPGDWEVLVDVEPGTALVAVEPDRPGFRANLVVSRTPLDGLSFRDWQVGTDELFARSLHEYQVLDLERLTVAGRPGGRRLAHHVTSRRDAVVLEQWCVDVNGVGWALTATVDVERYDAVADLIAECAGSFELAGGLA